MQRCKHVISPLPFVRSQFCPGPEGGTGKETFTGIYRVCGRVGIADRRAPARSYLVLALTGSRLSSPEEETSSLGLG